MDYIFFAVNAAAIGLTVFLLLTRRLNRNHKPVRLPHYLVSLAAGVGYYGLDVSQISRGMIAYYVGNLLPIILLVAVLVLVLSQDSATGS